MDNRTCNICGKSLAGKPFNALYCSKKCSNENQRKGETRAVENSLPRPIVGTICELRVAEDLLNRGYYVFRSMSPNSPFDVVAFDNDTNTSLKIEITAGVVSRAGGINYNKHEKYRDAFDTIAVVLQDQIIYSPPLPKEGA